MQNTCSNFCIRKAVIDDIGDIAEILYGTDPYIYPTAFMNKKQARLHLSKLIKLEGSAFHYNNILVAESSEGTIIGALCSFTESSCKDINYYSELELENKKLKHVCEKYFNHLIDYADSPGTIYIVAICVDEKHRGRGIGEQLLNDILMKNADKLFKLDVLCENKAAICLYQKFGFEIAGESYRGYAYPPEQRPLCYSMLKNNRCLWQNRMRCF